MVGHELAIEQGETAHAHPCDQPDQRNLRRIGRARKHAFTAKSPPQCKPVKAADQPLPIPAFDTVREAALVQRQKGVLDIAIDPSFAPVVGAFCT